MTAPSTFQIDSIHGRTVVSFLPHLNEIPWAEIEKIGGQILPKLQEANAPGVLVDLCALQYMGSASLALVVRIYKTVTEKRGRMVVANRDPMVGEVLAKAGLEKIWEIAPTREDGLRRLGLPASESVRQAGGWQNLVAIVGLLAGAVGVAAHFVPTMGLDAKVAFGLQFGGGALGFVFALWGLMQTTGSGKAVGAILLVANMGVLLTGTYHAGKPPKSGAAKAKNEASTLNDPSPIVTPDEGGDDAPPFNPNAATETPAKNP